MRKCLTIMLAGALLAPGMSHALDARAYVEKAIALIETSQFTLARTYLDPALIAPLITSAERSRAYYLRGFTFLAEDMPVSARKDFNRALEFSDTNKGALVELGILHSTGRGVSQDQALAFSLFEEAANLEYDRAQYHVGYAYLHGQGVEKNVAAAREWLARAAAEGHSVAMVNLAASYRRQFIADPQPELALSWYEKAYANGMHAALLSIGFMHANGEFGEVDHATAAAYYQRALDAGLEVAGAHLGYAYLVGRGVEEDHAQALALYERGAAAQATAAFVGLGHIYENGLGVDADLTVAQTWYERGATAKDPDALSRLISLLLRRDDAGDRSAALRWSKVAAASGRPQAYNDYAWLLATSKTDALRNGTLALDQAKKAVAAEPSAAFLDTLAAAYAELGNFEQAIATQREALASITSEEGALRDEFERRLRLYERSEPWRE